MSRLEAVLGAFVQADHRQVAGLPAVPQLLQLRVGLPDEHSPSGREAVVVIEARVVAAIVDRHDPRAHRLARRPRRERKDLRLRRDHEAIALADFLDCGQDPEGRWLGLLALTGEPRGAQVDRLLAERLVGVRIDELPAGAIHLPQRLLRVGEAVRVSPCARTDVVPAFLGGDDLRRLVEAPALDDERPGEQRLDHLERNGRDRLGGERLDSNARFHAFDRQRPGRAVEPHDVAGVDQVGVLDLVLVEAPDLGPAPRLRQELAGDPPKRVARLDDVLVGRVGLDLEDVPVWGRAVADATENPSARARKSAVLDLNMITSDRSRTRASV